MQNDVFIQCFQKIRFFKKGDPCCQLWHAFCNILLRRLLHVFLFMFCVIFFCSHSGQSPRTAILCRAIWNLPCGNPRILEAPCHPSLLDEHQLGNVFEWLWITLPGFTGLECLKIHLREILGFNWFGQKGPAKLFINNFIIIQFWFSNSSRYCNLRYSCVVCILYSFRIHNE